jgi:hypothetical protein
MFSMSEATMRAGANPAQAQDFAGVTAGNPPHNLEPPASAATLLEQQLSISVGLVRTMADYVAGPNDPTLCLHFMDRLSSLLTANAGVAKVVGRLRGGTEETCHRVIVEGKKGRGVRET